MFEFVKFLDYLPLNLNYSGFRTAIFSVPVKIVLQLYLCHYPRFCENDTMTPGVFKAFSYHAVFEFVYNGLVNKRRTYTIWK